MGWHDNPNCQTYFNPTHLTLTQVQVVLGQEYKTIQINFNPDPFN